MLPFANFPINPKSTTIYYLLSPISSLKTVSPYHRITRAQRDTLIRFDTLAIKN